MSVGKSPLESMSVDEKRLLDKVFSNPFFFHSWFSFSFFSNVFDRTLVADELLKFDRDKILF